MHIRSELVVILTLLIVSPSIFIINALAEDDTESQVDATIYVNFKTGSNLTVYVEMIVNKINVFDTTYTRSEIAAITDTDVLGAIKLRLRDALKDQLKDTFEKANVVVVKQKPTYENSLFLDDFSVNLTSVFFGLSQNVDASMFINGVLDMGATLAYVFNLHAASGWNNTYIINLPDSMSLQHTNGEISGAAIHWRLENWNGENPTKRSELSLNADAPSFKPNTEDVSLEFELDARNTKTTGLKTFIITKIVDIREYNILPDFITNLTFIPADGMRLFIDNGFISWNELYEKTIKVVQQQIISNLENSSFNQPLSMIFNWDPETTTNCSTPYNITYMDEKPPIKAILTDDDVQLKIYNISARAIFGLANAGATANISRGEVNFGDKLDELGYIYNGSLYLPNNIFLDEKNIFNWNRSTLISGFMVSNKAPTYVNDQIETQIIIDVNKMDLNLPGSFIGNTEITATVDVLENINLYVLSLPVEFKLPEKINLTYMNADALRLCIKEGVISDKNAQDFLENKKYLFETRSSTIVPGMKVSGYADRNKFLNSLSWDEDITTMDNVVPVIVSSNGHSTYTTRFSLSFAPPKFSISNQLFNLAGIDNQRVTYRIIFPQGLTINASDTLGKSVSEGKTKEGRKYIEITFDVNESKDIDIIYCTLGASPLYVFGLFLPCVLSLVLVIILIVIIVMIRKKRRRGKEVHLPKKKDEVIETEGSDVYAGQEYYVPPPPLSKRKK